MTEYQLSEWRLEIAPPVEVGRASGHHWFPSLHPVEGDDILCAVVRSADEPQGEWPAWLYQTRDGGRSWRRAAEIGAYGHNSVALGPRQILLMPYELWPLAPGDHRNGGADGSIITCDDDGAIDIETRPVKFLDFPRDIDDYHVNELLLHTNGNILPLADGRLFMTLYGRFQPHTEKHQCECVAATSEDGGFTWRYLATVASWKDTPGAPEGPDESNTARLPDGRLMCVYRVGSGREHHYHASTSADEGQTWTKPRRMANEWSVEPQLVCLDNGALLLSGGRQGLMLWVCRDGQGEQWESVNLAAHHNATLPDAELHFAADCVAADPETPNSYTTSYTSMKAVGPDEALISYDRLANGWHGAPGPAGEHDAVFTVRLTCTRL